MTGTIDAVSRHLEAALPKPAIIRHAAETQAQLSAWGVGEPVQVAALLAPLLASGKVTLKEATRRYGRRPLQIARIATGYRVEREQGTGGTRADFARKLRDLYRCAYMDSDAALVCAADRVASTSTIDTMTPDEQAAWGDETLAVDVPLMEMLGMWTLHHSMANLALALAQPDVYLRHEGYIAAYYKRHEPTFARIAAALEAALGADGLRDVQIRMHETTAGSLYKRGERARARGRRFDPSAVGPLRVDVIVPTRADCYHVIGTVHRLWRPSSSSPVRDEIASPRYNGYRALTVTVHGETGGRAVEFRIMTTEIEAVNRRGITAGACVPGAWWADDTLPPLLGKREPDAPLCALTPAGEIIYPLRPGSTLVDIAFKVHSQLGPYARTFYVDGVERPYDTPVQHRQMIEVLYDQSFESLLPEWADVAASRTARHSIERFLRSKVSAVHQGRATLDAVLERESNIYNLRFSPEQVEAMLRHAASAHGCATLDAFYKRVARGEVAPDEIVMGMIENDLRGHIRVLDADATFTRTDIVFSREWMQLPRKRRHHRDARIIPGTPIVGRVARGGRLVVYRADSAAAPVDEEAVPLAWGHDRAEDGVGLQVAVVSTRRRGVAWAVLNEINRAGKDAAAGEVFVHRFTSEMKEDKIHVEVKLNTTAPGYLPLLERNLNALKGTSIIKSFKIWELFPGERLLLAGLSDRTRRNPFQVGHIREESMFFGRDHEIQAVVDDINRGAEFLIIHGHKRIGKTSLMYHLAEHILPVACPSVLPVMLNAQEAAPITTFTFAEALLFAARTVVEPLLRNTPARAALSVDETLLAADPLRYLVDWVHEIEDHFGGRRLFFFIDEFTALLESLPHGSLQPSFFQRLHAILDTGQVAMTLCIHDHVLRHDDERFRNMVQRAELISIRELDEAAARSLVREPLHQTYTYDPGVEDRIMALTNAHPYFIHILCGELVKQVQKTTETRITEEALRFAVVTVLDQGFHRFAAYRSSFNKLGMEVLGAIAQLCGPENDRWAQITDVRARVIARQPDVTVEDVQHQLDKIYWNGVIVRTLTPERKAQYRIPVGLLHIWQLEGTRPLLNGALPTAPQETTAP